MLSGTVLTSSNVASVEVRVATYSFVLTKTDVGHFEGNAHVPRIPFFIGRNFTLLVIARNTAGVMAQTGIPFQIR